MKAINSPFDRRILWFILIISITAIIMTICHGCSKDPNIPESYGTVMDWEGNMYRT